MRNFTIKPAGYGRFDILQDGRIFLHFMTAEDVGEEVTEMLNADVKFMITYE